MTDTPDEDKKDLAEYRTDWAEDRTVLANERTYAAWMRTGMASVAIGLGFQAIFRAAEPTWPAKLVATLFIVIGIFVFWTAWSNARGLFKRLTSHAANPITPARVGLISGLFSFAACALVFVLWTL